MPITPTQLAYLPQGDKQALMDWAREHSNWHKLVAQKAIQRGNLTLGTYDVADMADLDDFLYFHNAEHENTASVFGIGAPPDLSYWDQEEPINWANWLQAHALTHLNEQKALGL